MVFSKVFIQISNMLSRGVTPEIWAGDLLQKGCVFIISSSTVYFVRYSLKLPYIMTALIQHEVVHLNSASYQSNVMETWLCPKIAVDFSITKNLILLNVNI